MAKIKEERPDEAEILELAAKMVEQNKAKMATAATATVSGASQLRTGLTQMVHHGQPSIINFFRGTATNQKIAEKKTIPEEQKPIDEESQRGKFGWVTLGKVPIPYILRKGEKYCAVRMVESKILNKYFSYLHGDIYSCTCIRSYYITEAEARVLNDINVRHCDGQFGREHFTNKDLVVRFLDACEFYNFLDVCYNKLMVNSTTQNDKCGFIRINGESVVPYTVRGNAKFVPLFYFEGETESLKTKAENLEGWDLAYLKFCCKVQGIRNELFASETCSVISLVDIKSYFPAGTIFEDYWPAKVVDSQLILGNKGQGVMQNPSWTKQPAGAVPVSNTKPVAPVQQRSINHSSPVAGTPGGHAALPVINGCNLIKQYEAMASQQQQSAGQILRQQQHQASLVSTISAAYNSMQNMNMRQRQSIPSYYFPQVQQVAMNQHHQQQHQQQQQQQQQQQPPPLVRSKIVGASPLQLGGVSNAYGASAVPNMQVLPNNHVGYQNVLKEQTRHIQPAVSVNPMNSGKFPPPLVANGATNNRYIYGQGGVVDVMDLSGGVPSRTRSTTSASSTKDNTSMVSSHHAVRKLIQISDITTTGSHTPYQIQKALVDGKMVPCINTKPYVYSELLMTLNDLIIHFFPNKPVMVVQKVLQDVLNVNLYKGNRAQTDILRSAGKCRGDADTPLIQVRDVMQYMPQLKYVLEHNRSEQALKRQRTS